MYYPVHALSQLLLTTNSGGSYYYPMTKIRKSKLRNCHKYFICYRPIIEDYIHSIILCPLYKGPWNQFSLSMISRILLESHFTTWIKHHWKLILKKKKRKESSTLCSSHDYSLAQAFCGTDCLNREFPNSPVVRAPHCSLPGWWGNCGMAQKEKIA